MRLYKNVDICDLESISEKGILSLKESGNNNWSSSKRVDNSIDVVYLFSPIGMINSFPKSYGIALIEIELDENQVSRNQMVDNDVNKSNYIEYVTERVSPDKITRILIPSVFKSRINLPDNVMSKIEWCEMSAQIITGFVPAEGKLFGGKLVYEDCDKEILKNLADTTPLDSNQLNFFRALSPENKIIDFYNIQYVF